MRLHTYSKSSPKLCSLKRVANCNSFWQNPQTEHLHVNQKGQRIPWQCVIEWANRDRIGRSECSHQGRHTSLVQFVPAVCCQRNYTYGDHQTRATLTNDSNHLRNRHFVPQLNHAKLERPRVRIRSASLLSTYDRVVSVVVIIGYRHLYIYYIISREARKYICTYVSQALDEARNFDDAFTKRGTKNLGQ